jgi:hypothetical protein
LRFNLLGLGVALDQGCRGACGAKEAVAGAGGAIERPLGLGASEVGAGEVGASEVGAGGTGLGNPWRVAALELNAGNSIWC